MTDSPAPYRGGTCGANLLPTTYGPKETWTLTCETPGGRAKASRQVYVDRGQVVDAGRVCRPDDAR